MLRVGHKWSTPPIPWHELLTLPLPLVQIEITQFGQIMRLHANAEVAERLAVGIYMPGVVGDAEGTEQVLVGELGSGMPVACARMKPTRCAQPSQ